jgi:hypothetical protein
MGAPAMRGAPWATISTPTPRAVGHGGRDKGVLAGLLGDDFAGVLVSDCSGGSTRDEGRHQYCWAHLLRDVHDLTTTHPRDAGVRGWAEALVQLYQRASAVTGADAAARRHAQRGFERERRTLWAPYVAERRPQTKLCRPIARHRSELVGFVADPSMPHQQRRRAQPAPPGHLPQAQRRHPLSGRHRHQDDGGHPLRHLATARTEPARPMPSSAHVPTSLNSYHGGGLIDEATGE